MTEFIPTVSQHKSQYCGFLILPRSLLHLVLRFDQRWAEGLILLLINYAVVDRSAKKPSEPDCCIIALGFQMAAKRLGACVYTKYGLYTSSRTLVTLVVSRSLAVSDQGCQQGVSIPCFVSLVPHRTERVRRESIEGREQ